MVCEFLQHKLSIYLHNDKSENVTFSRYPLTRLLHVLGCSIYLRLDDVMLRFLNEN